MAALTYPSQCLPDELLEAKIKVKIQWNELRKVFT